MAPLIVFMVGAALCAAALIHLYILAGYYLRPDPALNLEITMSTFKIGQSAIASISPKDADGNVVGVSGLEFTVAPAGAASVTPIDAVSATITALAVGPFVVAARALNSDGDELVESVACETLAKPAVTLGLVVGVAA